MSVENIKTESKNELKKINIKNRTCYYFDDIMKVEDIDVNNILLDEKSYENILVFNILYKKFIDAKSLCIRFNKVNGLIKTYNGIRYLELSDSFNEVYFGISFRIYNAIFERINYLISTKSGNSDSINHNFARGRIVSYNSLPIEKALTFRSIIILIMSLFNHFFKNNYYYNIFFEKGSYKESNTRYF